MEDCDRDTRSLTGCRSHRPRSWRLGTASLIGLAMFVSCGPREPSGDREVTLYVSVDRRLAEPIIQAFQQRDGVRVTTVYDVSPSPAGGLSDRILAERASPRADVVWSNEPVTALRLKFLGALAPYRSPRAADLDSRFKDFDGYWTAMAAQLRVIVYNTSRVQANAVPISVFDLASRAWKGQVVLADPRLDSVSFQVSALYMELGDAQIDRFFRSLKANDVRVLDSDQAVVNAVARGEALVGLTNSDVVGGARAAGAPVDMVLPDVSGIGVALMPTIVSVVAGAPHPDDARRLVDYLVSSETEQAVVGLSRMRIPLHAGAPSPRGMPALDALRTIPSNYAKNASNAPRATSRVEMILGR